MALLDRVTEPADVRAMDPVQLTRLAGEIRDFLVKNVSKTGGHLGPNLGVVELTIALHRVFDYPNDVILFDTGHQTYVHKLLTGRKDFTKLRQRGGLSGYASRAESVQDVIENSHATTALSWADGIARGFELAGRDGLVVAVIGDGALTGGMAWEALNNIAEDPRRPIVIVVNDNGRSYAPTVGGFMRRIAPVRKLDNLRVDRRYEDLLDWGKNTLQKAGTPGQVVYEAIRGFRHGMKEMLFDAGIFDSLGLKYLGPVDGHDIRQLEEAFTMAKRFGGPVVVHAITVKGFGYQPAEQNKDDHFHAVGKIHPETGLPVEPSRFGWTSVFAAEMRRLAEHNPQLVGVTAAMLLPVGLGPMKEAFPERVIDVGIAEQHALTMSAGLAYAGFHPVVALYATFMNRGFDQLLMDIALHKEAVTIALDRSGVTGADGPSHNGMWDLAIATEIPGLRVAIPRDGTRLRRALREAIAYELGPTLVRYPKGPLPPDLPALRVAEGYEVLYENRASDDEIANADADAAASVEVAATAAAAADTQGRGAAPMAGTGAADTAGAGTTVMAGAAAAAVTPEPRPLLLWGMGPLAPTMLAAAQECTDIPSIVIDVPWVLPIPPSVIALAVDCAAVLTLEDGVIDGGIGAQFAQQLAAAGVTIPVRNLGISKEFLLTASRPQILAEQGMDLAGVRAAIRALSVSAGLA